MNIPFVDLYAQYQNIKPDIDNAIERVIANTSFIGGEEVSRFEEEFADFLGIRYCISCANGTDSIEILLQAMGIGPGDEVIVPSISWISTSEAVSNIGAVPVFVDIDPRFFTIDVSLIESAISEKTKAIIPVHLYGHPANMTAIVQIAKKHGLKVLEDAAQAHGAEWENKKTGTLGDAASFSFYPGKNLGAYGDAGAMVTDDEEIAEKARLIARHGQKEKHTHLIEGRNSRMDGIQAAILRAKLPYLQEWTQARLALAAEYGQFITNINIVKPLIQSGAKHVFHLYVIQTDQRTKLQKELNNKSVQTSIHYPTPLPFLPCYAHRQFQTSDFPEAYKLQSRILSLPIYPELPQKAIKIIADIINNSF